MRRQRMYRQVDTMQAPLRMPPSNNHSIKKWAYGVTTIPERRGTYLPDTLKSLANAGFNNPRLFIDGCKDTESWQLEFGLEVTSRYPRIKAWGNWILALYELYIRMPHYDLYAIFQDDLIISSNLRKYLEHCPYPQKGYWNLYTFPENQKMCPEGYTGWYASNQRGKGGLGLVFNRETVLKLLTSDLAVTRPMNTTVANPAADGTPLFRGQKAIDGGVVDALSKLGWKEYVHNPSLVEHTGIISSMNNGLGRESISFRGESFDALSLVPTTPAPRAGG